MNAFISLIIAAGLIADSPPVHCLCYTQFKKLIEKKGYKVTKSYMNQQKQRKGTNDGTGVVVIDLRQSPAMLAHAAGLEYAKGRKAKLARKAKMKKLTTAAIPVAIGKCLETLHGMQLHGRTIRVQRRGHGLLQALSKVMAGESSRYFAGANISTKCMNCGQVGHTQKSCGNAPLPTPCHLCAGSDHDAGEISWGVGSTQRGLVPCIWATFLK